MGATQLSPHFHLDLMHPRRKAVRDSCAPPRIRPQLNSYVISVSSARGVRLGEYFEAASQLLLMHVLIVCVQSRCGTSVN